MLCLVQVEVQICHQIIVVSVFLWVLKTTMSDVLAKTDVFRGIYKQHWAVMGKIYVVLNDYSYTSKIVNAILAYC